jgi:hypothetical protein
MRIAPRPLVGLIAFVGYLAIVYGAALGTLALPIDRWAGPRFLPILLSLGAVFLVLFTRYVGWWRPVMREEPRTAPRWAMAVTALYLVVGLVALARLGVFTVGVSQTFTLAFYSALYGFSYVILYQGLLLMGFRASMPEVGVWFFTSLMFAFPAMLFLFLQGQPPLSDFAETIGLWFLGGTALYVVRMAQGSLVPAMVIYALWDFALRTGTYGDVTQRAPHGPNWLVNGMSSAEGLIFWLMLIVTAVATWQIIRAKNAATTARPLPLRVTSAK